MRNDEKLHLHKQKLLEREKDEVKFGKRMIWLVRRERGGRRVYIVTMVKRVCLFGARENQNRLQHTFQQNSLCDFRGSGVSFHNYPS